MDFGHLDLVILCLLMLKIIRVSYFYETVHPDCWAAVFISNSSNISLWKKTLNFFRTLQAGFVQTFPYGCLPCDTSHISGALKGHQSLWNWHSVASQQRTKLTFTCPHGERERQLVVRHYMI